jgi:hypothetical protein
MAIKWKQQGGRGIADLVEHVLEGGNVAEDGAGVLRHRETGAPATRRRTVCRQPTGHNSPQKNFRASVERKTGFSVGETKDRMASFSFNFFFCVAMEY